MRTTRFVKIQKRIVRAKVAPETFFTVPMLEAVTAVTPSTVGLDPDSTADRHYLQSEWIKKHKRATSRPISEERRAWLREHMKRVRRSGKGQSGNWEKTNSGERAIGETPPSPPLRPILPSANESQVVSTAPGMHKSK
jgi:hypothetical protein